MYIIEMMKRVVKKPTGGNNNQFSANQLNLSSIISSEHINLIILAG